MSYPNYNNPCDDCGSSDALAIYGEGDTHCFSCSRTRKPNKQHEDFEEMIDTTDLPFGCQKERGISKEVCEIFGVRYSVNTEGQIDSVHYPYHQDGQVVAYKIRKLPKEFKITGEFSSVDLFGQQAFKQISSKRLVITEGEQDALAVAQAYKERGKVWPVVSLPSASNMKPVLNNLDWIRSFDEVILWTDNDDAGIKARDKLARMIGYNKTKVANSSFKDASDALTEQDSNAVVQAIWNAHPYNPQGILSGETLWSKLEEYQKIVSVPYPLCLNGLNDKLKGMREGEITLWTSGTGSGKSTILREIVLHLLENTDDKIGIIALEETPAETVRKLSGMAINKNPAAAEISNDILREGFDKLDADRLLILDHAGSISEGIIDQLNYMASAGCKYLFIDHITILVSEGSEGLSGNEAVDKVMNDLLRIAKTHNVWIGLVSHLRKMQQSGKSFEDGTLPSLDDIRGSGSIKQISMDIVAFSRDIANDDEAIRNTIDMRVLKCRYTGLTGNTTSTRYDYDTGRLILVTEEF